MTLASAVHLCRSIPAVGCYPLRPALCYPAAVCRACGRRSVPGAGFAWSARYRCLFCCVVAIIEGPAQYGPDPPRAIPRPGGRVPWADLVDPGPVRSRERAAVAEVRP